ncbi:hypothetical protein F5884DRAFT_835539 [Xylogone sp. PMI_703]|nr:hypothetical protein F5884DRAFT_835539 [Xylogone sp. PMI_703]
MTICPRNAAMLVLSEDQDCVTVDAIDAGDAVYAVVPLVGSWYSFDDVSQQLFSIKSVGIDNTYLITHLQTGLVVDLLLVDSDKDIPIIIRPLHWTDNRLWKITSSFGNYMIRSVKTGRALVVSNGGLEDGTPIVNESPGNGEISHLSPPPPAAATSHEERCWLGLVRTRRVVLARARAGVEDGQNMFDKEVEELMGYVMGLEHIHCCWWHNAEYRRSVQQFSDKWDLGLRWATASQRLGIKDGSGDLVNRMKRDVKKLWDMHNRSEDMIKKEWMETLVAIFEFIHGRS